MLKKIISSTLILSLFSSNICLLSKANTEILNRYETLEGEVIDLGNTESEDTSEIEIFGNTVQDPDNLEDIQSVGDLYVDKEGQPILDSQGREQYTIDVLSSNKNLFDEEWITHPTMNYKVQSKNYIKVNDNLSYVTNNMNLWYPSLGYRSLIAQCYDKNYSHLGQVLIYANGYKPFTLLKDTKYIKFDLDGSLENIDKIYCQLNIGEILNNYIPHQSSKTTILLPCQLMKIGNVADRLYWDNKKGRYIVEKRVGVDTVEDMLDTNKSWLSEAAFSNELCEIFYQTLKDSRVEMSGFFSNFLSKSVDDKEYIEGRATHAYNQYRIILQSRNLNSQTKQGVVEYLKSNNFLIYKQLSAPQLIETNITKQIKLPIYKDKTYIYAVSENGVNPTLKIYIDRIEQVSGEAVDLATSTPTSSNIALARMYVNMLPDSLYKDQLQAKLNEIFSEDIVLEKQSATANLDIYIKCENLLSMTLDTNMITFENYSSAEDMALDEAISIRVNSSLPYQLNAYFPTEIQNADGTKLLDKSIFNIKESSEDEYKKFTNLSEKVVLKDNCKKGNDLMHLIDLKLSSDSAHDADVYKTTIKFEIEQK